MKVVALPAFKNFYKNPYNYLLYSPMSEQGVIVEEFSLSKCLRKKYDIFHLHWPLEQILAADPSKFIFIIKATALLILIDWMRFRGTRIVWTIHNFHPHDNPYPVLSALFLREFLSRLDGYINLSKFGKTAAEKYFPLLRNCSSFIVPHGHYRTTYPNEIGRNCARLRLGIPEGHRILVFFGRICPYKNVPYLIRVFRELTDSDLVLIIAGKPDTPATKAEVLDAAGGDSRVKCFFNHVSNEDIQVYLNAADLVILPFQEILNSGSALLALSYNCPILVPAKGSMSELQAQIGEAWVRTYSEELTAEALCEGCSWALFTSRPRCAPLAELNWCQLSQKTLKVYRNICQN